MDSFLRGDFGSAPTNFSALVLGALLAFLAGQTLAWVYMQTHRGLSYSRSFVVSLVIMPVIVSLVMSILANNLVTAFGLMAVFAIVRFRNILRDTLDTAYILGVLVLGMACGMQRFTTAVIGCIAIGAILVYLWATSFGIRNRHDMVLSLRWARPLTELSELEALLQRHTRRAERSHWRTASENEGADMSYRLLMRDPSRLDDLLNEVKTLLGVSDVTGTSALDESEI